MSLNKVMLIGNVGMDPEIRYLNNSQDKVARVRLATSERYTDRNGEQRENTEWHTVTCWRRTADIVEKYVKKGTQIYVEGRLQTREWTDNSGAKRYSTEVNADNIQLLGRRSDAGEGAAAASHQQNAPSFNQGRTATTPAGPGGYQAPYQPNTPAPNPIASAPAAPAASASQFEPEDDDLPF